MKKLIVMIFFCLIPAVFSHAQELSRIDLVPKEADIIVRCPNIQGFITSLKDSPPGTLISSQEMKPFFNSADIETRLSDSLYQVRGEKAGENEKMRRLQLQQLKLVKGEIILALNLKEENRFFITAAMAKDDFKESLALDKKIAALDTLKWHFKKEKFRGIELHTMITTQDDKEKRLYQGHLNNTLIESNQRDWIEAGIALLLNTSPKEPSETPGISFKMGPGVITRVIKELNKQQAKYPKKDTPESFPDIEKISAALGLNHFQGMEGAITMKPDRSEVTMAVRHTPGATGLWTLLSKKKISPGHRIAYVPTDYASYNLFNLDLAGLWKEIPAIVTGISPESRQQYDTTVEMLNAMLTIDLTADIFNHLADTVFSLSRIVTEGEEALYGFSLNDSGAMGKSLDRLFSEGSRFRAMMGDLYGIMDIKGNRVHLIRFPRFDPSQETPGAATMAVGIADNCLVIGSEALAIPFVQASLDKGSSAAFYKDQDAMNNLSLIPEDVTGFSLSHSARHIKAIVDFFKSGEFQRMTAGSETETETRDSLFQTLKFDQLPSAEFISGFFGNIIGYTQYNGSLFTIRSWQMYPDR